MRKSYERLVVLVAPLALVLLRLPLMLSRDALYGLDPYIHLHFVKAWLDLGAWPLLAEPDALITHDYNAWPGAHALAASLSSLGPDPMQVMDWLTLLFLLGMTLAVVLVVLRRTDPWVALATGLLLGMADYIFFQTQWYIPELVGLFLISCLLLNELAVGRPVLSILFLVALLVTHHLSFLIGAVVWVLVAPGQADARRLVLVAGLVLMVLLYWDIALRNTGSFPDIMEQVGGVPPAFIVAMLLVALVVVRAGLTHLHRRRYEGRGPRSILGTATARYPWVGRTALLAAVVGILVVTVAVYLSSLTRFNGLGFQPTKLLVLVGGVLFIAYVPAEPWNLRVLAAFSVVALMFALTPVFLEFLPLEVRFLEFLYLLGFVLLAASAHALVARRPGRARAVVVALLLVAPVLHVDDVVRYEGDGSQRFVFSRSDIDLAEEVGARTEADAIVVPSFSMRPVVIGVSERRARTEPVRVALDEGGYGAAVPYLKELKGEGPVYLLHSERHLYYMEDVDSPVTEAEHRALTLSLEDVSHRLTPVLDRGGHLLYAFERE